MENPALQRPAHQMLLMALVQLDLIKHPGLNSHAWAALNVAHGCAFGSLTMKHRCFPPPKATQVARPSSSDVGTLLPTIAFSLSLHMDCESQPSPHSLKRSSFQNISEWQQEAVVPSCQTARHGAEGTVWSVVSPGVYTGCLLLGLSASQKTIWTFSTQLLASSFQRNL